MFVLKIENIDLKTIKPYANNPKEHPENQIAQIATSIQKFGFTNPILIDENDEIIAGHGRFLAAKTLNLTTVPVIRLAHLNKTQKQAYRLADNKIAQNGGWNLETLRLEFTELDLDPNQDLSLTGFSNIEIDKILYTPQSPDNTTSNIPFINACDVITQPGDIWKLGPHKIICGNSLEEETFQQLMGDTTADMILQDPPYNVKISGHVCGAGQTKHKEFMMASGELSNDEFTNFLKTNFALCARHSAAHALHYNFMDWRHISNITAATKDILPYFINMCIWVKENGGMGSLYRSQHELCFIFGTTDKGHTNNVELGKHGRYRTNVWHYAGVNSFGRHKTEEQMHPTVKPVEMLQDAILDVTTRGDLILDSFLGSGSTLIAAHKTHRICYGIELDPLYIDTTIRRFQSLFNIDAVHVASGKTYNELLDEHTNNKGVQ